MEVTGKILQVLPLQTGQGKNGEWKKQSYVIEYNSNSQYPKKMMFTLWGEKIAQSSIKEGQVLKVDFDIDCQEFNGRWYNDIRAWRISASDANDAQSAQNSIGDAPNVEDIPF